MNSISTQTEMFSTECDTSAELIIDIVDKTIENTNCEINENYFALNLISINDSDMTSNKIDVCVQTDIVDENDFKNEEQQIFETLEFSSTTENNSPFYILDESQLEYIETYLNFDNVYRNPENRFSENEVCGYCQSEEHPIFNIRSVNELKDYINENGDLNVYHPDGYTFAHRLCWNYAKQRHSHRDVELSRQSRDMIYYLSELDRDNFVKLFSQGHVEDAGCTPFHEYIRYITVFKAEDFQFLNFMQSIGIDFNKRDKEGLSVNDYYNLKYVHPEIHSQIRYYQYQMKLRENRIREKMFQNYSSHFHTCQKCNRYLNLYHDIDHLSKSDFINILTHSDVWDILEMVRLREIIMNMYATWSYNYGNVFDIHLYCINVWKRKLLQLSVQINQ